MTTTNNNKANTYVIHNDNRGPKPTTSKLANTLRMVQPGEYFYTKASNQGRVHSLTRSLNKTFSTHAATEKTIRVTCIGNW